MLHRLKQVHRRSRCVKLCWWKHMVSGFGYKLWIRISDIREALSKLTTVVRHIWSIYSFTVYICKLDFLRQKSEMCTFKICNRFSLLKSKLFEFKIVNSDFYLKNPSCVHFRIYNWNFYLKNPSCVHFKICNSNFCRKNASCVLFIICNYNFYYKSVSCFVPKFATRIQYLKNPSCSYCSADFCSKNWSFVVFKFATQIFAERVQVRCNFKIYNLDVYV